MKWNGEYSSPRPVAAGSLQGINAGGILEYLSHTAHNLSFIDQDSTWKFIDDESFVEILNLCQSGLASYNCKLQVPSDLSVSKLFPSPQNCSTQSYLDRIHSWADENLKRINTVKSKYMILNYCQDQFQTRLNINNIQISQVKETRLLGCIIRDDLKWVSNTNDLIKRAYARMTILRKLVQFEVPKCDLVHIYTLFIRSILEQSCVVWGAAITQEESKALERVQKCCLKLIFQDQYLSYENGLFLAGLSDLETRRNKLSYRFAKRCT